MTRFLIFSDIQGSGSKLKEMLRNTALLRKDEYVCLGDIVGEWDFSQTNYAVQQVRQLQPIAVRGNHERKVVEEFARKLTPKNLEYIANLPVVEEREDIIFYHSSLQKEDLRLRTKEDYALELATIGKKYPYSWLAVHGHMHKQALYSEPVNKKNIGITEHDAFGLVTCEPNRRYIANPGGAGLLFGEKNGCMVVDSKQKSVRFYDADELASLATRARLTQAFEDIWLPLLTEGRAEDFARIATEHARTIRENKDLGQSPGIALKLEEYRVPSSSKEVEALPELMNYAFDLAKVVKMHTGDLTEDFLIKDPVKLAIERFSEYH